MAASTEYRPFCPGDVKGQKELFAVCFPELKDSPSYADGYFKWKFADGPEIPPSYQYVAEQNGEMVGYYAALPLTYTIKGATARVALVVDVMVHPKMQGQGIFRKIGLFALQSLKENAFDFTTGYPIRPQVMPGHLKAGWKVAFDLPLYISVLSSTSILRLKKWTALFPLIEPLVKIQALTINLFLSRGGDRYRSESRLSARCFDDPDFLNFQRDWLKRQSIAWDRSPQTMRWRLSKPATNYHSILLRNKDGVLVGHALTSSTVLQGVSTLAVLDIQFIDDQAISALHRSLRRLAAELRCDTLSMMTSRAFARKAKMPFAGFIKMREKFRLITNNLSGKFADDLLHEPLGWHLSWLDTDDL